MRSDDLSLLAVAVHGATVFDTLPPAPLCNASTARERAQLQFINPSMGLSIY
jgi:hypothetical protein